MEILKRSKKNKEANHICIKAEEFLLSFVSLFDNDKFVSRKELTDLINSYKDVFEDYSSLYRNNMIDEYCKKYLFDKKKILDILYIKDNYLDILKNNNEKYLKRHLILDKQYLDDILKDVDENVLLDEDQRRVVLSDEDFMLVVAGAGAGKTTTMAAKTKYLIEKKNIKPNEILIVSFTNKAVNELKDKINKSLKLDCLISTFHSVGYSIMRQNNNIKYNIVDDGFLYNCLQDYFRNNVFKDKTTLDKIVLFFSSYLDMPLGIDDPTKYLNELANKNYSTLKGDIDDIKKELVDKVTKKNITIQNEQVRSYQEVRIANFLYLNGIDYEYEPLYQYNIQKSSKPYTPDFVLTQNGKRVYLEHFGISESGKNKLYSNETLKKYIKSIKDKINIHKQHHTELIYTFSQYNDHRDLLEHLSELLINKGFVLNKRSNEEVMEKIIISQERKYIDSLVVLIMRFINLFKTNGYTIEDFNRLKDETNNVRNKLFLDICKECYVEYEKKLKETKAVDFQDMINDSIKILESMKNSKEKLRFKYVIVDEYQDISQQRFDLVGMLHEVCDAKIVAVGDDWQSIYAFSGSNVKLFTDFEKKMGYADLLKIEMTYRNGQDIIDIAGNFIQKNDSQIKKTLKSNKKIDKPIIVKTYSNIKKDYKMNNKSGSNFNLSKKVEESLDNIVEYAKNENEKVGNILIIGRYNYDISKLESSGLFEINDKKGSIKSLKYPLLKITFMTAHSSKGLGFDNVILINGINGLFGFPSKIDTDPIIKMLVKDDNSYEYAEERRLFYVTLTRTKNRVYIIAPEDNPSEFIVELKKEYKNVIVEGNLNENYQYRRYKDICPICNYPLQYKYKQAYGLRLYICTNNPEVCDFMTNSLSGLKMQIKKCDSCQDGYLIVKKVDDRVFLGCTNYLKDGSGCNNTISLAKYNEINSYTSDAYVLKKKAVNQNDRDFKVDLTPLNKEAVSFKTNQIDDSSLKSIGDASLMILSCIERITQKKFYGVTTIVNIMRGKIKNTKYNVEFDKLPEYGSLKDFKAIDIEAIIYWLINNKYLHQTKGLYPVVHITSNTRYFKERITKNNLINMDLFVIKYKEVKKNGISRD